MEDVSGTPASGKTAEEILKSKAKIERARLKRVADREAAKKAVKNAGTDPRDLTGLDAVTKAAKKAKPAKKAAKKAGTKLGRKLIAAAKSAVKAKMKTKAAACERSERLDMRLSKAEKAKVQAKAKKLRRTITSVVLEAVEKIK